MPVYKTSVPIKLLLDGQVMDLEVDASSLRRVAATDPVGIIPHLYMGNVADGPTGDVDQYVSAKMDVFTVVVIKTHAPGGPGVSVQVRTDNGNPVTDAMSLDLPVGGMVRATTIDPLYWTVRENGVLRVRRTKPAAPVFNAACRVLVFGLKT